MPTGVLYLVATPLGNLEDITLRALRILREVDLVACEDTRRTGRLLKHFEIDKPLQSCRDQNEARRARELADRAAKGESIALVSDAGTPTIADPGYRVVKAAIEADVRVVPIPGPNAALVALAASGLPTDRFQFHGFLPSRQARRRAVLGSLVRATATAVYYEAPHRILAALADIDDLLGDRELVVARELTKLHEEFLRGTASSILERLRTRATIRGEFVLLVAPSVKRQSASAEPFESRLEELAQAGLGTMDAIKQIARERGIPKGEVYARARGSEPRKR